jgi:hypothetical protein
LSEVVAGVSQGSFGFPLELPACRWCFRQAAWIFGFSRAGKKLLILLSLLVPFLPFLSPIDSDAALERLQLAKSSGHPAILGWLDFARCKTKLAAEMYTVLLAILSRSSVPRAAL